MVSSSELRSLRARLRGRLVLPEDDGYRDAARAWNLAVEQRPAAVVYPADVPDVQELVRAAASTGLSVLTQPNGHSAALPLDDVILVRPVAFDEVAVDTDRRIARVGAGANWGRVLAALDATGLIALAGSNPEVNAVAYSLAGGHSLFARAHGLQSPTLTAVELVDASGEFVRVTEQSDQRLMWALRGAGGLFGVVTAIEFSLFDGGELYGGKLVFPPEAAQRLLTTVFDVARAQPTLGLSFGIVNFPNAPVVPESLRGKTLASVDVLHIGGAETGAPLLEPLRAAGTVLSDTMQVFGIGSLSSVAAEPTAPMPYQDWGRASNGYDSDSAESLVAAFGEASALGLSRLEVRPFGGALLGGDAEHAIAARIDAASYVGASAMAPDAEAVSRARSSFAPLDTALAATPATGNVPTFLSNGSSLADSFAPAALERLRALKTEHDPQNVIRGARPLSS
ncbi:FAD-binding oxidoreductase [Humibacter ginsenosidimutans]|uniref:FAD-binding oxidoreductase n=1 Tax=Humibacter ginsenosidimutans TaxID=2599293 RepID=A0A5B8M3D4_9MICO|nr:FAD-binding protein [Humibacter ginsenosidimutans]QDZ14100.1 FAD-binding oxidoreductase [Humibacter ginsenosidimutans]